MEDFSGKRICPLSIGQQVDMVEYQKTDLKSCSVQIAYQK